MLVRCHHIGLAIAVTEVHATLPEVTLQPSPIGGRVCRGMIEHAGAQVPAVDPLALLELGALSDGASCQALLLRYPAGLVAMLVSRVIDIVQVPERDLLALPPLAVRRPELFGATLHVNGHGEHLLLGVGMLRQHADLQAMAGLNVHAQASTAGATGKAHGGGATGGVRTAGAAGAISAIGTAVITYDLGAEVATRLSQVDEVLAMPAQTLRPASGHPAVTGLFLYRGRAVTLVCLASLLGGKARPDPVEARVLLVSHAGATFGFVVPRLCNIEHTAWEEGSAVRSSGPAGHARHPLGQHTVIELGQGAQRRTLHLVDLQAVARALSAPEVDPDVATPRSAPELSTRRLAAPQGAG